MKKRKPTKEELQIWEAHIRKIDDEKYPLAVEVTLNSVSNQPEGQAYASISFLQRKVHIGYNCGERLIQRMVRDGILQVEETPNVNYFRYKIIT